MNLMAWPASTILAKNFARKIAGVSLSECSWACFQVGKDCETFVQPRNPAGQALLVSFTRFCAKAGWTVQRIMRVLQVSLFERSPFKKLLNPDLRRKQKGHPQMRVALWLIICGTAMGVRGYLFTWMVSATINCLRDQKKRNRGSEIESKRPISRTLLQSYKH